MNDQERGRLETEVRVAGEGGEPGGVLALGSRP
jgi:hypothetical protein